jgi:hypothetical protein
MKPRKRPVMVEEPVTDSCIWEEHHTHKDTRERVTYTFKCTAKGKYYVNGKDVDTLTCNQLIQAKAMLNKLTFPSNSSIPTKDFGVKAVKKLMDKNCPANF